MICRHFGICGGCDLQNIDYDEQIEMKKNFLKNIFGFEIEIEKSDPFRYRNRMDFVYSSGKLGLRKKGSWNEVIELEECIIAAKEIEKEMLKVREFLKENKIESYDLINHKGYLRYVVIRHGQFTGDLLTIFVVAKKERFDYEGKHVFSLNASLSDISQGEVFGKLEFLKEKLGKITYFIHPNCFFQTNPSIALKMFSEIRNHVYGKVADLFAGVGAISFFIADKCEEVKAIEINKEALQSAIKTAQYNKIENVKFFVGDAREFSEECDVVVVDPPRAGCGKKLMKKLRGIEKIIYLSCNPKTQAIDVSYLQDHKIVYAKAFDAFPQTKHIENLIVLERI